jgi:hypothetical protein
MPRSRAIRRASGDALTRPSARAGSVGSAAVTCSEPLVDACFPCSRSSSRAGAREPSSCTDSSAFASGSGAETCSPSSPITAIVWPTGTSPSATAICSRTPEASASTSWVTLSVSSS